MKYILCLIFLYSVQGCDSKEKSTIISPSVQGSSAETTMNMGQGLQLHRVIVLEVIQVENYTYLRVKEEEGELWMAAPKIITKPGEILYYSGGMLMTSFESKELNRTFDKILFVDKIAKDKAYLESKNDTALTLPPGHMKITEASKIEPAKGTSKDSIKQQLNIEPPKGGISIAALLKDPKSYEGKKISVRGKVTKYTAGVMGKNWAHIQDGTAYNGKFEIVITTLHELKTGDTATFEGIIILNKDLGYGYFFEVLMEDARLIK